MRGQMPGWDGRATPGWISLPFTNGWTNIGGGHQLCQLQRIGNRVYARGLAAVGGAAGIALLPEGYRPPATLILDTRAYTGAPTPTEAAARVDLTAAGVLSIVTPALGTSAWVSLSGLDWAID